MVKSRYLGEFRSPIFIVNSILALTEKTKVVYGIELGENNNVVYISAPKK